MPQNKHLDWWGFPDDRERCDVDDNGREWMEEWLARQSFCFVLLVKSGAVNGWRRDTRRV